MSKQPKFNTSDYSFNYVASPTGRKFHASNAFVRGLMGPVGSGKSVTCCIEIFLKAKTITPCADGIRRSRWLVVRNTSPQLETTTIKTWLSWFPEHIFGKMNMKPPITHNIKINDMELEVIFLALDKGETGRKYFLSDGEVYQSSEFSNLVHQELGCPWWIRITAPIWLLRVITWCGDYMGRMSGKMTVLNNDKFNILRQRNWRCDIEPARKELGFEPQVRLAEGVRRSIEWYKANKWI
jgi:hypothetical protein